MNIQLSVSFKSFTEMRINEIKSLFLCLFQNKSYSEKNIFSKNKMEDSVDYITNQYLQRSLLYSSPSAEKCKYTQCTSVQY